MRETGGTHTPENSMSRFLSLALICMSAACSGAQANRTQTPTATPVVIVDEAAAIDSAELREQLAARRNLNLDRLLAYANAGEFPLNTMSEGPLNIFVDSDGHICAAANLIDLDGNGPLVQTTAAQDNFILLADVNQGPLMDWMLTSGFTQEEIALIQRPYMPVGGRKPVEIQPMNNVPEPVFATVPVSIDAERQRVQKVLIGVHTLLSANTKENLGIAMARLEAKPKLAASLVVAPRPVAPRPRFAVAPPPLRAGNNDIR
jgi:hypothetical protein